MTTLQLRLARPASARRVWASVRLAGWLLALGTARAAAQSVAEVQVTPETMTIGVGARQTLFAAAYDRQGNLIPAAKFTFWSSDTLIARVLRDGTVLGVAPGLAKVEARAQGRRASLAVLITGAADVAGPPAGSVLTLEPASTSLIPGESVLVEPQAILEDGTPVPAGRVAWKSLRADIAVVDSSGLLIGVAPGRTIVQATTKGGLMATLPVEVQPADFAVAPGKVVLGPEEIDTLATVVPAQGNRRVHSGIQWTSSDTGIVRVGPTGILTALAPGKAEIVAVGFGQERRAAILVHRDPESVVVSPRPGAGALQLPLRATQKLTATAEAADSTPIPEARFAWAVADTAIVGFDPATTTLTGRSVGSTTVSTQLRGFDPVVWNVTVIPGNLGLERRVVGLALGERQTIGANLVDDSSKVVAPATGLRWSADRSDRVQVSGNGVLDGLSPGRAVVTAEAPWGQKVTAQVFVTAELLTSSNRSGAFGIYQLRTGAGDTLAPILVDRSTNVQPALSPDRTRIAFSSNRNGSFDLFVMDADGGNPRRITTDAGTEGEPAWTPDGSRIVYTSTQPGAGSQLRSITPDGKDSRLLTNSPGGNQSPDVSPDGRTVVFISAREGNQDVYLMDIAGGEPRRVAKTPARESSPRFLPNGDIVCVTERGGRSKGSRLVRLPAGAAVPATLLETDEPIASIDLSRDGARVAYVTGRMTDVAKGKAQFNLFVQPLAAGGTPTQLVLRPGEQVAGPAF